MHVKKVYSLTTLIVLTGFILVLTACKNNKDDGKETDITDTATMEPSIFIRSEDSAVVFTNKADDWISKSLHNSAWNWSRFQLAEFWYEDSLQKDPYEESKKFYSDFAPLLKWSPDSSYILDLGTIGTMIIKDKFGKPYIADGDIDTEISMRYPKTEMKSRILYFGSTYSLIDAKWLDKEQVAILASVLSNGPQADTLLWVINAKENYFRKYKWK